MKRSWKYTYQGHECILGLFFATAWWYARRWLRAASHTHAPAVSHVYAVWRCTICDRWGGNKDGRVAINSLLVLLSQNVVVEEDVQIKLKRCKQTMQRESCTRERPAIFDRCFTCQRSEENLCRSFQFSRNRWQGLEKKVNRWNLTNNLDL